MRSVGFVEINRGVLEGVGPREYLTNGPRAELTQPWPWPPSLMGFNFGFPSPRPLAGNSCMGRRGGCLNYTFPATDEEPRTQRMQSNFPADTVRIAVLGSETAAQDGPGQDDPTGGWQTSRTCSSPWPVGTQPPGALPSTHSNLYELPALSNKLAKATAS